ncbi:oxidoreductase [Nocardia neocaledoniensis]|uniref:NAD(P)-dependent dehydrogenase (Short-subunit alcohol dehydrogenase family) n=1 Tax=Nocardia neocaledoniensis TaxID=236511 RepID=A0A317NSM9_9NOCA|nr:oxidoreductase [Nocardia neocaledoniensis]PWV77942.1 NAD(P)-dependent dehydrogenase (short-subunit alcohol dehydrogenase family) [Nocardia neocaledoniensis]GEM30355.1 putative short-chain dehydrogenase/reductase [Nocardia neocaledoniensis NBRC 108232]
MSKWTAANLPDQTGRTIVVTGANSGLGAATARALSRVGARVILACRDTGKAQQVAAGMPGPTEVRELDLANLNSVRAFTDAIERVDVLINNAGVMALPLRRTGDGFEMQFGTNHLGHFALTNLLLDRITDRVVTVSSLAHRLGRIDLDDPNWERRRYDRWLAYGQSKLANLMFAYELQRRLAGEGSAVVSVAAHPGYAATELMSHTESVRDLVMALGNRLFAQDAEQGALPTLFAATADIVPGAFYGPDGFLGLHGHPARCGSSDASKDRALASELWELSEKLCGLI